MADASGEMTNIRGTIKGLQESAITKQSVQYMIDKSIMEKIDVKLCAAGSQSQPTTNSRAEHSCLIVGGFGDYSMEAAERNAGREVSWSKTTLPKRPTPT